MEILTVKKYSELGQASENVIFRITKSRTIRISIKQDLQITVSFPKRCSQKKAQEFFESKIIWAHNSLQKMEKRGQIRQQHHKVSTQTLTEKELADKKHYIILRCKNLAQLHNFKIKKIILRKQKTIWGSCSHHNNISLNSNLAYLKEELIDYVILHELAHTRVKNHSRKFWEELEKVLPNYHELNRELKNFSPLYL